MAADYHSDFWVVVGTAAPILLLASVVNAASGAVGVRRSFLSLGASRRLRRVDKAWGTANYVGYWIALVSFFAELITGYIALYALGTRDSGVGVMVAASLLLLLSVVCVAASSFIMALVADRWTEVPGQVLPNVSPPGGK